MSPFLHPAGDQMGTDAGMVKAIGVHTGGMTESRMPINVIEASRKKASLWLKQCEVP